MIIKSFMTQFRNAYEELRNGNMEDPSLMLRSGEMDNFMKSREEIFEVIPMLKKPGIQGRLEHKNPLINL